MKPKFGIVYSSNDGGFFFEFWDAQTGKDLYVNGRRLESQIYPSQALCSFVAKRTMKSLHSKPKMPLTAGTNSDRKDE